MKPTLAKILVRLVGTLAGLVGVIALCIAPPIISQAFSEWSLLTGLLILVPFAVAAYPLYLCYVVWFRLSPSAVRHVCSVVGLVAWASITSALPGDFNDDNDWVAVGYFMSLFVLLYAYKALTAYFTRLLFASTGSEAGLTYSNGQPGGRPNADSAGASSA